MTKIKRKDTFSIIHDNGEEERVSRYCHHCMEYGFYNKLGPKILIGDERPAPDHDKWCQCLSCGHIYPIYEAKIESKLQDFVETSSNPFDTGKSIVGLDNKVKKTRFQKKIQRLKDRIDNEKDLDIKRELRKGNDITVIE